MLPLFQRVVDAVRELPPLVPIPEIADHPAIDESNRSELETRVNELEVRAYLWRHQPIRRE